MLFKKVVYVTQFVSDQDKALDFYTRRYPSGCPRPRTRRFGNSVANRGLHRRFRFATVRLPRVDFAR